MGKKTPLARLRDPGTIFSDPDSEFSLSGREQRPLPRRLGPTLTARIRTGAIIVADDPPAKGKIPLDPPLSKGEGTAAKGKSKGKIPLDPPLSTGEETGDD